MFLRTNFNFFVDCGVLCDVMKNEILFGEQKKVDLSCSMFVRLLLVSAEATGKPVLSFLETVSGIPPISSLMSDREGFFAAYSHMLLTMKYDRQALADEVWLCKHILLCLH
jgi:hypothetical protein